MQLCALSDDNEPKIAVNGHKISQLEVKNSGHTGWIQFEVLLYCLKSVMPSSHLQKQ